MYTSRLRRASSDEMLSGRPTQTKSQRGLGMVAAGWYPDYQNPTLLRWWDGRQWTGHTHPLPAAEPVGSQAQPTIGTSSQTPPTAAVGSPASTRPALPPQSAEVHGSKRELRAEVARLHQTLTDLGVGEREALQGENARVREEISQLRQEEVQLTAVLAPLRAEVAALGTERAAHLSGEIQKLRQQRDALLPQVGNLKRLEKELQKLRAEYAQLSRDLVETRETAILQEVGIYEYRHPLQDAIAYKARLAGLQAQIKDAVKAGNAVQGTTNWTVNGSAREGAKMVREFSKLMLRAYNNEADNAVRSMKPYTLESSIARLQKSREVISKLGGTMKIRITDRYHGLWIQELELTADYLAKVAEEKERNREERARLREEEVARREYEREQQRLQKEYAHYEATAAALREQGDHSGAERAETRLTEIQDALDGINRRAANIRAGHVYVISHVGAFGGNMIKIGMTRRLDPMDRVRELGDASVPFRYDVHAMIFSDDAISLEHLLHQELASKRVNLVNVRREFFRAHPAEVRDLLVRLDASIITWVDEPEALEWRQSETARRQSQAAQVVR
jgi:hypothetical protein